MKDRSVHNIRIERLWVEVKWIIVTKWKPFFGGLEAHHGLRMDSAAHIWLLHHLFLESLNNNIQEWAEHSNTHGMRLKREKDKVPKDMFILGMRRHVLDVTIVRQEEAVEDVDQFGIDWDGADDEQLVRNDEPGTRLDGYHTSNDHPQYRGRAPEASRRFGVRTKLYKASMTFSPPRSVAIK
jgi:hypothetical protein